MTNRYDRDDPRRLYSPVPPDGRTRRNYVKAPSTDIYTYTTETGSSDDPEKAERNCSDWMKYGIFTANIVFLVVGGILLAMGVWLRTDSRFREFISERYRQAVENAFWEAPTLFAFSYIIIVMGCCMIVIAMFGCCGTTGKSRLFLIIYTIAVFLLLIATLACGIYLLYKKDGIDVELSDALNYMVQHYYMGPGVVQEALDRLQTTFRCCGNAGCSDFRVFRQDIPRSCDIRCDGCHYRIMVALRIGFSVTLIVFSAVVLCQVLAIIFALYFVFMTKKEVRIVYVEPQTSRREPTVLTRDALRQHDLPYGLKQSVVSRKKFYY
ncbi:unnamed protein product [Caenorhabditis bovis]|uniref:Tetraspanin n=1 Tax=Caenorhabditis bovis TaxID=2654633 RepID=A0A8S1EFD9_9PELO|nr:unnamed protein product [Caenorhabditis bovis]